MESKKKRQPNFSFDEKLKLLDAIKVKRDVVLNKKTDGTTIKLKEVAWNEIGRIFNSMGILERSVESLRKMWEKMKSEAKLHHAKMRAEIIKTGCVSPEANLKDDPIVIIVLEVLGRAVTGVADVYDCDTEILFNTPYQNVQAQGVDNESPRGTSAPGAASTQVDTMNQHDIASENYNMDESEIEIKPDTLEVLCFLDEEPTTSKKLETSEIPRPLKRPWSAKRRPAMSRQNERSMLTSDALKKKCSEKSEVKNLRKVLLQREYERLEELHQLKLKSAKLEVEIKEEILKKIRGGDFQHYCFNGCIK